MLRSVTDLGRLSSPKAPDSSPSSGAFAYPEVVSVDRCDRCCAKPHVWWAPLATDLDERALMLCHRHSHEHEDALVQAGWVRVAEEAVA